MIDAGVPLWRVNIGQRFANPLLVAWGVVWTPKRTESYDVTHERMLTNGYVGSSFKYILENRRPLHKSLRGLDPDKDHSSYIEFAEHGGTDFYATFLYYGDESLHGCTFATRASAGFSPQHLSMIEAALPSLSSALEPVTMRKSSRSLLRAYLGDGILSIFPIPTPDDHTYQCRQAVRAAQKALCDLAALNDERARANKGKLEIGIGINSGKVSYGNIGSPGRLDFTVLGGAVNLASRIEGLTKSLGHLVLVTKSIAEATPEYFVACGLHDLRGLARPIELFCLSEHNRS